MSNALQRLFPHPAPSKDGMEGFIGELQSIVGAKYVLTEEERTRRYRTGYRFGRGRAVAVVRPGCLLEQWRVLKACVSTNKIVIMQAANTGLTGGSTPDGDDYDRDIVIISTLRMKKAEVIEQGKQIICFPGATLNRLEKLLKPLGREPHSVIGSSCIGASVFGGVSNNSGGALVQRGPAYTEMALFAQLDADGGLQLVNHLGVRLGNDPETILDRLDRRDYTDDDIVPDAGRGSDYDYIDHVRAVDADTPARFNADPKRLHEASGCAGKLILFAVRLDTFPAEKTSAVFYIGSSDVDELEAIRRRILSEFSTLPISGEYLHRDAFDVADKYGKDTFLLIYYLGTERMPPLFALKGRCDAYLDRLSFLPSHLIDRILQGLSAIFPNHLPARIREFRDKYEHHLMLKAAGPAIDECRNFLKSFFSSSDRRIFRVRRRRRQKGLSPSLCGCGRSGALPGGPSKGCGGHRGARYRAKAERA